MSPRRGWVRTPSALLSTLALLLISPAAASSQIRGSPDFREGPSDAALLVANGVLGGLTVGLWTRIRGGEADDGFVAGLVGGALGFAGKRVAAEPWEGAGLLGRQISSVGASVVRNASDGRAAIGRLVFPVGPVRIYWEREPEREIRVRVDLPTVVGAIYALTADAGLDSGASLSSGALVFSTARTDVTPGRAVGGTVLLREDHDLSRGEREAVFAHERVHVLQYDQALSSLGEPLDTWLVGLFRDSPEDRWVDLGTIGLVAVAAKQSGWPRPPWELEADGLDGLDGFDGPVDRGGRTVNSGKGWP